jgi:NAD(P)-dependent dehydrogenase (short-subunit alcohol dehydrogenase family)
LAAVGLLGHGVSLAGTEAFSRLLAAELAQSNIRIVCIRPHAIADAQAAGSYTRKLFAPWAAAAGLTDAELLSGFAQETMLKRLPTLADVAETAAFLASDRASAMTATVADLTCGAVVD